MGSASTTDLVVDCRECGHPYEAHHDYLFAGSMLCWTRKAWVNKMKGYQSCNCPGYRPDVIRATSEANMEEIVRTFEEAGEA